ncbi:hypothetical protein CIB84_002840 [Bambusicola thoracicus]|uniref:Large ribosomal subunit protein mL42 n=1 Tax=Bambusicola thoracicus TaxID=9083 RepID=A0A2P4TAP1_BAMTH|nr:hypothetical protein CIB84_002840 [Bambusicola thoracicus]
MASSLRALWPSCLWMRSVAAYKQVPLQRIRYNGNIKVGHGYVNTAFLIALEIFMINKVELALTSDSKTIVCYHPSLEIPYEHTKPVPRPDPVNNKEETLDQVLKSRLDEEKLKNDRGLTIEELSKMFYTTKHRWYPVGRYQRRRKNPNPPKDR